MNLVKNSFGLLRYSIWIIGPIILFLIYLIWGSPYFRWSYSWLDEGQGYDPFAADRYYTRCTYWGLNGSFTIHPDDGSCAWVQLFKETGDG